ncbi:multiple epidermal growth factor-like domains protein 11 [Drosophila eugracilis]|uniref:multiple epidermal growth factor-like domains protein 11 n=1 Tax=Drosophila eugracilis TaxID=29029 RepID=UPI001BD9B45D|nr:multiple epidermal growth factor-like domains protein 11 [Drosophila eugracilis]
MKFSWALFFLLGSVAVNAQRDNYCERNVTIHKTVPVIKERIIVRTPSKLKFWKKAEKITEQYESIEERVTHQLIKECCPGYLEVESRLCEPICTRGCPAHASCAAPDRCECISGYVSARNHQDGSHYCEPICQTLCSAGAQCVSPNTCACREGYTQLLPDGYGVSGDCAPVCQVGNGCANGKCIDVERCSCNAGYRWDKAEERCIEVSAESISEELELAEESSESSSTSSTAAFTVTECPDNYVLFHGECREKQFNSNEVGCLKTGCGPHQTCLESGSCHCSDGYAAEENTEASGELRCVRTLLDQILGLNEATDDDDELNPWTIPIIGVASGFLFVLLIVGLLGGKRYRQERAAVANKEMDCQYSSVDVDKWVP